MGSPYEVDYKKCVKMDKKGKKIGLALSGGGYRAAAYHIGTFRALHKMGILDKVDIISSISGGSIIAAYYALHKDDFQDFDAFVNAFVRKLQSGPFGLLVGILLVGVFVICILTCGVISVMHSDYICICVKIFLAIAYLFAIGYVLVNHHKFFPSSKIVQWYYDKHFYNNKKLMDLPDMPILAINATEITQNQLMTFSKLKVACGNKYPKGVINPNDIPVSLAVMASSAYPLFSPIILPSIYFADSNYDRELPILVDGGIYDNQGLHKLSELKSDYHVDCAIVSNACNAELNNNGMGNVVGGLYKCFDLLMNRIEKMQMRNVLYQPTKGDGHYAYVALLWKPLDTIIDRYFENIKKGQVPSSIYTANGLTEEQVEALKSERLTEDEIRDCVETIKEHVRWSELRKEIEPILDAWSKAKTIGTNLKGLSKQEIDVLSKLAEWQTTLQVRLHLPNLL